MLQAVQPYLRGAECLCAHVAAASGPFWAGHSIAIEAGRLGPGHTYRRQPQQHTKLTV